MAVENQILELRTYSLVDAPSEKSLDKYLEKALIPALNRQGLKPIGAFDQANGATSESVEVMLLIPGADAATLTGAAEKLAADEEYQQAARDYLAIAADQPVLKRIRSELLLSFDCWPHVSVPPQKKVDRPRLFELRVYESPTEHYGDLKVEMFNSGEVPIFLDCGITPVFMGKAMIGDLMPNLTYMTVYDDNEALQTAWGNFQKHPDWQVLKAVEKFKGTVSKIHKSYWTPKAYSQL